MVHALTSASCRKDAAQVSTSAKCAKGQLCQYAAAHSVALSSALALGSERALQLDNGDRSHDRHGGCRHLPDWRLQQLCMMPPAMQGLTYVAWPCMLVRDTRSEHCQALLKS
jgi:hypothetical protein